MHPDEPISDPHDARAGALPSREATMLLRRAEARLAELRGAAQLLTAVLPTRVEAAVARALDDREGARRGRQDGIREDLRTTAAAAARVERDVLAEQVSRAEDLGLVIDVLARGL